MVDAAEVLSKFGIPWPDADTTKATDAAGYWTALGNAAQAALDEGNNAANVLCANNTGAAMAAFSDYWDKFGGAGNAANLTVLVGCCKAMSEACDKFAGAVVSLKQELEEKAGEIAGAIGGGVLLTVFTAGFSDAAAGGIVGALLPEAWGAIELFGTSLTTIAGTVLTGGAMGLLEETMSQVGEMVAGTIDHNPNAQAPSMSDDVDAFVTGSIAGPIASGLTNAAKGGVDATVEGLSADANIVMPQLPKILNSLPTAVDTPAGKALVDLVAKTSAKGVVSEAQGKDPEMPSADEIVGALLDAKIESAAESSGE